MKVSAEPTLHAMTRTGNRAGQSSADKPAETGGFGRILERATGTGNRTGQPPADDPAKSGSLGRALDKTTGTDDRLSPPPAGDTVETGRLGRILGKAAGAGNRAGQPPTDEPAQTSSYGHVPQRAEADGLSVRQPRSGTAPANDTRQAEPAAETAPRRMNWPDFTVTLASQAEETDVSSEAQSDARTEKRKIQPDAPQPTQRQQMPDSGPWLIVPQGRNHDLAASAAGGAPFEGNRAPAALPDKAASAPPAIKTMADPGKAVASPAVTAAIDTGKPATAGPAVAAQTIAATAPRVESGVAADIRGAKGEPAKGEPAKGVPTPDRMSAARAEPLPGPAANSPVSPHASAPEAASAPTAFRPGTAQPPAAKPSAAPTDAPTAPAPSVTVTGAQSFPAPASYPAAQTMTALAGDIATDSGARQVLSASAGLTQPSTPVAVGSHMLKIELHPAELGMVTASLRLAGGQLSIELKPENQEAHRRLSSDTDTLVKSLQGLGFNVDKVTVLQPTVATSAAPRMDAPATANPGGRDSSSFQPGGSGTNGGTSGGQQSGRNSGNDGHQGRHGGTHPLERSGGGLFI